jgi:hypothetical protein
MARACYRPKQIIPILREVELNIEKGSTARKVNRDPNPQAQAVSKPDFSSLHHRNHKICDLLAKS